MKTGLLVVIMLLAVTGLRAQTSPLPTPPTVPSVVSPTGPTPTPTPVTETTKGLAPTNNPVAEPVANPGNAEGVDPSKLAERRAGIKVTRLEKPPIIDGRLDDEAWKQAAVVKNFLQVQPGDNIAPSKPTEVYLAFDSKFLYIAFHVFDDPGKVRATVAKRDAVFDDDNVGIYLDTFNDKRRAYVLFFNPFGVQADAVLTEGVGEDYSVDIVMESKGSITPDGYVVEVAVPFKSLRYKAGKDNPWGVHFFRSIKRQNNELDSWMPLSRDRSGLLNQEGLLSGFEGLNEGRIFELIPSLTVSEAGRRTRAFPTALVNSTPGLLDPGRFVNDPIHLDPGLTAKLGLTSTVTLDLAINPDFAQVEADQTVVTANQRFPIFFEEKRPFFLEGIEIFRTPLTVVHTRAIVDPDIAAKLTGKVGRNTFGLLFASDNAPGNFSKDERTNPTLLPSIQRFLDKNAYIGIVRLKRDIGSESSIGLIATTYNFIERHNHTLGFDGRFRFNQQLVLDFQVVGTTSRRFFADRDLGRNVYRTGNALGYSYNLNQAGRHYSFNFSGEGRTRDYRADVGFTQRTNTNRNRLLLSYSSEPKPKATLISYRLTNATNAFYNWQGDSQGWNDESRLILSLPRQTSLTFGSSIGYERVFEEEFGPKRKPNRRGTFAGDDSERSSNERGIFFIGSTTPHKALSASIFLAQNWGQFDFDFGGGPKFPRVSPGALINPNAQLDPGPGSLLSITSSLVYRPINELRASLDYTKSRLVRYDTGRVAFDDNIYSLRATYQFTRFWFTRARVDYDTLAARMRGQFLLGWTPNPGTAFYVGYNDDMNRSGFNSFTGQFEPGFRRNGRTFFIKMSYLFRRTL
jgi:hypothetical protein